MRDIFYFVAYRKLFFAMLHHDDGGDDNDGVVRYHVVRCECKHYEKNYLAATHMQMPLNEFHLIVLHYSWIVHFVC